MRETGHRCNMHSRVLKLVDFFSRRDIVYTFVQGEERENQLKQYVCYYFICSLIQRGQTLCERENLRAGQRELAGLLYIISCVRVRAFFEIIIAQRVRERAAYK